MKWLKKIGIVLIGVLLACIYSYRTWPIAIYDTNVDSSTYENVGELKDGARVEQSFFCEHNGLKAIKITASNLGFVCDAAYHWELQEVDSGRVVAEGTLKGTEIDNSQKTEFSFDTQRNSKDKEYLFVIETEKGDVEHGITVMKTKANKSQKDPIVLNGTQEDSVMVLTQEILYLNVETGIVFIGIYLYLVFFMIFLLKLFK